MAELSEDFIAALLTLEEATARRDAGMAQVEENADADWLVLAWDTLVQYLKTHSLFFCDDFWRDTQLARPRESRALGPLIKRASSKGYISQTGECRPSVSSNMTKKDVWRSHLFEAVS